MARQINDPDSSPRRFGGTLHLAGVTRFTGLKSTSTGQENPEVSGDLEHKLAYEVSSG